MHNNWEDILREFSNQTKIAIFYTEDNLEISYKELYENTAKTANLLKPHLQPGDRVSILARNSPEFVYSFFATLKLGAIFNPINPDLTEKELKFIINDSGSTLVIVNEDNYGKIKAIKDKIPTLKHIIGTGFHNDEIPILEKEIKTQDPLQETINKEDCLIMYSSGTTGNPKGIVLTQQNTIKVAYSVGRRWNFNKEMVAMASLPLFFSGGLMPSFLAPIAYSAKIILPKKFSKSLFFPRVTEHQVNYTFLVPTMLSILLNPPHDVANIECLHTLAVAAAPLPLELANNFEQEYNIKIYETYGLTENAAWCTMNPLVKRKLGSIGTAMDINEIKIVNQEGKELPTNTEGEIVIKGPNVFNRYWNQPEKTNETLKDDWLYSGDLGHLDNEGYLYITGRVKELIIKGGENIAPKAIDEVFYQHPDVADAATIGIPDKIYGEEIKTYITQKPYKTTSAQEFIDYCKQHLAEFKCPKEIEFIDNIPKGPSGKLLRRELLQLHLKTHHKNM